MWVVAVGVSCARKATKASAPTSWASAFQELHVGLEIGASGVEAPRGKGRIASAQCMWGEGRAWTQVI